MARDCISSVILLGVSLSGSVGCFYGLWVVAGVVMGIVLVGLHILKVAMLVQKGLSFSCGWCSLCGILGVFVVGSSCNTWIFSYLVALSYSAYRVGCFLSCVSMSDYYRFVYSFVLVGIIVVPLRWSCWYLHTGLFCRCDL